MSGVYDVRHTDVQLSKFNVIGYPAFTCSWRNGTSGQYLSNRHAETFLLRHLRRLNVSQNKLFLTSVSIYLVSAARSPLH